MEEVARGNDDLAERKGMAKRAEAEEAQQIAEYIRQRDAREQVWGHAQRVVGDGMARWNGSGEEGAAWPLPLLSCSCASRRL